MSAKPPSRRSNIAFHVTERRNSNPDDNRHDLRPFLYVVTWPWQFNKIKAHLEQLEKSIKEKNKETT